MIIHIKKKALISFEKLFEIIRISTQYISYDIIKSLKEDLWLLFVDCIVLTMSPYFLHKWSLNLTILRYAVLCTNVLFYEAKVSTNITRNPQNLPQLTRWITSLCYHEFPSILSSKEFFSSFLLSLLPATAVRNFGSKHGCKQIKCRIIAIQ